MTEKKPALVAERFEIRICPVCGKRAYSHTGVHPQCSVQQADAPRQALLAEARRQERVDAQERSLSQLQTALSFPRAIP